MADRPEGSPTRAVKSPRISTATWPASWNRRRVRSTTAWPRWRSEAVGSSPSFTRRRRPVAILARSSPGVMTSTAPWVSGPSSGGNVGRHAASGYPGLARLLLVSDNGADVTPVTFAHRSRRARTPGRVVALAVDRARARLRNGGVQLHRRPRPADLGHPGPVVDRARRRRQRARPARRRRPPHRRAAREDRQAAAETPSSRSRTTASTSTRASTSTPSSARSAPTSTRARSRRADRRSRSSTCAT